MNAEPLLYDEQTALEEVCLGNDWFDDPATRLPGVIVQMRAVSRLTRLGLHLLAGTLTVMFLFPRLTRAQREHRQRVWARDLLDILRVGLRVIGTPPTHAGGMLLAANHVSWLDIHVIHGLIPARFISKLEVQSWPILGRLAAAAGTLFMARHSRAEAGRIRREMAESLAAGDCLALFPEGTTSDGCGVNYFFAALFQPATDAGAPVVPVALRYLTRSGRRCPEAAYYGDISLGQSLWRIANLDTLIAEVNFLPALASADASRKELAHLCERAVHAAL